MCDLSVFGVEGSVPQDANPKARSWPLLLTNRLRIGGSDGPASHAGSVASGSLAPQCLMEDRTQAGQLGEALGAWWGAAAPSPRPRPPPRKLSEPRPSGLDRHLTGRGRTAAGSASPPQPPDPRLVAETIVTDTPSSRLPVHSSRSEGSENERTKERCRGSEATARAPGPLLRLQEGSAVTAGSPPAWTARPRPPSPLLCRSRDACLTAGKAESGPA